MRYVAASMSKIGLACVVAQRAGSCSGSCGGILSNVITRASPLIPLYMTGSVPRRFSARERLGISRMQVICCSREVCIPTAVLKPDVRTSLL
jgi:hypothetical protein